MGIKYIGLVIAYTLFAHCLWANVPMMGPMPGGPQVPMMMKKPVIKPKKKETPDQIVLRRINAKLKELEYYEKAIKKVDNKLAHLKDLNARLDSSIDAKGKKIMASQFRSVELSLETLNYSL